MNQGILDFSLRKGLIALPDIEQAKSDFAKCIDFNMWTKNQEVDYVQQKHFCMDIVQRILGPELDPIINKYDIRERGNYDWSKLRSFLHSEEYQKKYLNASAVKPFTFCSIPLMKVNFFTCDQRNSNKEVYQ